MHLRDVNVAARVGNPGLLVDIPRRGDGGLPGEEIEVRIGLRIGGQGDTDTFHEYRVCAETARQVAARDDGGGGAVGLGGAVVQGERPGYHAPLERLVHGDLFLQHALGRQRAIVVVLHGDLCQFLAPRAVGLEVACTAQRKPACGRHRQAARAIHMHAGAGHAAILGLVKPDHEHRIVHPGGYHRHAVTKRIRAGSAVVLHERHGPVEQLQRLGDLRGTPRGIDRAAHHRVDAGMGIVDAGVGVGLVRRLDDHVLGALVPVLAELAAAHADDGDLVADRLAHDAPPAPTASRTGLLFQK